MNEQQSKGLVWIDLEETKAKVGAKSDATIYDWIKTRGISRANQRQQEIRPVGIGRGRDLDAGARQRARRGR